MLFLLSMRMGMRRSTRAAPGTGGAVLRCPGSVARVGRGAPWDVSRPGLGAVGVAMQLAIGQEQNGVPLGPSAKDGLLAKSFAAPIGVMGQSSSERIDCKAPQKGLRHVRRHFSTRGFRVAIEKSSNYLSLSRALFFFFLSVYFFTRASGCATPPFVPVRLRAMFGRVSASE